MVKDVSGRAALGDVADGDVADGDVAGGDVGNAPGMVEDGLEKYASFDSGLFWRKTGFR